ncbi:MAG TPA: Gfo/Idh/MocA family oxidoreductase [Candidatus Eisenbergiella intestinipullorum]|nr:Gfo/Idh/MocA family oxidoreductase [Candidatus Eisenbergiella intestinipullorum]
MRAFRFAIMGAGKIAGKFCEAARMADCEVAAVASKSEERAREWAEKNGVKGAYGNYERMLEVEKPDCVYIATTPDSHYRLASLCLDHGVPVLCEKAAFLNSAQAREIFSRSRKEGIFVMEALWSRFLPAVKQAERWIAEGIAGRPSLAQIDIGFLAPAGSENRYRNPGLGGGAAYDITVYAYEIARFLFGQEESLQASAVWGPTGVDVTDHVTLHYPGMCVLLTTSFDAALEERAVIYTEQGRIVLPHPHFASEVFFEPQDGGEVISFRDTQTQNGFVYEIAEAVSCIRAGKTESLVVPHALTLACAELFDRILETKPV